MKMKKSILTLLILLIVTLSTSAFATEFSADVISQLPTGKMTGKLYFKNADISRNETMGMIIITKRPLVYQIFSNTKKYHVSNIDNLKEKSVMADAGDFKSWVKKNKMKKIGKETIAGYKCQIYEGDIKSENSEFSPHIKLWLSKKLNYPIKSEVTLPAPMGKLTTYLENITVGKQQKSLFSIPSGYVEAQTMQEAMGMPDMGSLLQGMATDADSPAGNRMSSPEEREKMMKNMQEMMEQMQQNQ